MKYFNDGKEITEEEARNLFLHATIKDGKPYPSIVAKFHVSFSSSHILKGSSAQQLIEFNWSDLAGSMCPHIPNSAHNTEGIWYIGEHVKDDNHDHKVYWSSIHTLDTIKAALK
ncbi:hypothetical protein ACFSQZ_01310 [Rubritalea spongiae]|uniref:Uncharacterized protein n=1 Tax=Rubritalea spongiae TaxID=430797 RepID=A0ABW5E2M7_9BACT